ncbi:similar to Saccharomyces cerevisiae YOL040C RPS15 Protein component of the small (40S) ribosomal subunit [Maudiozyma barnettii]|uniref:Similar to Saccharomyces cerevisiae YOL040C RPS15 Protein component of the small (40S) ribosomal subunit n=1 Tax=Maudiozyma barnettii TaxID=61262 RepID=A0A8H2ZJC4_9SACH|nr:ribosomal 40S subunit protein S15 [Kazachstania barnettii]CAB4254107.1 similar to Saccharomyces cerevisiae YOL040C RPS15 Protein component of the small (40S) ribosomal subunit [Kazachstania barnettii]CAD1781857.1 similar to Saccharomyces cerevisiae YOL040C RPS15 Protein component of the small (40S) ribosomal subunit [Kazachstania barnettii]
MSAEAPAKKNRIFKTHSYRGVDLDELLGMSTEDFIKLTPARVRRRFARGLSAKPAGFLKKLRAAKLACPENEKPAAVRTHLRNMIIVPEMIGSNVAIYNGKSFNQVEIRPEMLGHYLGEFSITYTPVRHGRAGATTSRFVPLK